MENPPKRFSKIIGRIDHTRDVFHHNVTTCFPVLDRKESNVNMTRPFSRLVGIDNINCRFIVFIDGRQAILRESEFAKNRPEKSSGFGSRNCSNKFCFS